MIIDPKYQAQLVGMHSQGKFTNGSKVIKNIKRFLNQYNLTSVLDFGCGHGALLASINQAYPNIHV